MLPACVTRLLTVSIENANCVERFADRYMLAPLHYLLTQRGKGIYPETYRVENSKNITWIEQSRSSESLLLRIVKIFVACIGALLLTLPGVLLKRIAQCDSTSAEKHRALLIEESTPKKFAKESDKRVFFLAKGPIFHHLIPFLEVRDVNALMRTQKGQNQFFKNETVWMKEDERSQVAVSLLWHTIAWRFSEYRYLVAQNAPIASRIPESFVKEKMRIVGRLRQEWERLDFHDGDFFFSLVGGAERYVRLPNGSEDPSYRHLCPAPVFRFETSKGGVGIGIRVIRTLRNPVTMPPINAFGEAEAPPSLNPTQQWEPKTELITLQFKTRETDEVRGRAIMFGMEVIIESRLWPHYERTTPASEQSLSWAASNGRKWLQDLLDGKESGPFPGQNYITAPGSEAPQVSYRLCPEELALGAPEGPEPLLLKA